MGATAPIAVSVEDYLRRTEKPNSEYIDGVLYPKAMPTKLHSWLQFLLVTLLRKQNVEALAEVAMQIRDTKYRIPDVIAGPSLKGPYPTEPVLLCIEILSPGDHLGAMLAKCEEYHEWGVPFCWVIDPVRQSGWEYHAGGEPLRRDARGALRAGELTVAMGELLAEIPAEG